MGCRAPRTLQETARGSPPSPLSFVIFPFRGKKKGGSERASEQGRPFCKIQGLVFSFIFRDRSVMTLRSESNLGFCFSLGILFFSPQTRGGLTLRKQDTARQGMATHGTAQFPLSSAPQELSERSAKAKHNTQCGLVEWKWFGMDGRIAQTDGRTAGWDRMGFECGIGRAVNFFFFSFTTPGVVMGLIACILVVFLSPRAGFCLVWFLLLPDPRRQNQPPRHHHLHSTPFAIYPLSTVQVAAYSIVISFIFGSPFDSGFVLLVFFLFWFGFFFSLFLLLILESLLPCCRLFLSSPVSLFLLFPHQPLEEEIWGYGRGGGEGTESGSGGWWRGVYIQYRL